MTWTLVSNCPSPRVGSAVVRCTVKGALPLRDLLRQVVGLCLARVVARGVALVGPQERVADRELHVGHHFVTQVDEAPAHAGRVPRHVSHLDHAGDAGLVSEGVGRRGSGQEQSQNRGHHKSHCSHGRLLPVAPMPSGGCPGAYDRGNPPRDGSGEASADWSATLARISGAAAAPGNEALEPTRQQ